MVGAWEGDPLLKTVVEDCHQESDCLREPDALQNITDATEIIRIAVSVTLLLNRSLPNPVRAAEMLRDQYGPEVLGFSSGPLRQSSLEG